MDNEAIEKVLAGLPLGPIRYFDRIDSTNTEAARWAAAGAPDLSLVVADEQIAGKGRLGRRWHTPPGSALAFSLVLRLQIADGGGQAGASVHFTDISRLTALGALGVREALQDLYGLPAAIKWPNDVLVGGKKLAGILVEANWQGDSLTAAVLGIGINVAPSSVPPAEAVSFPATSVDASLQEKDPERSAERLTLLRAVLDKVLAWRARLTTPDFITAWEAALAFRGEWVSVFQDIQEIGEGGSDAARREGQIIGLSPDGALRLRSRSGEEFTIQVGEIHLRPTHQG
jgi:BirA family biotin operon repressor/biotin-[acetyl-CoA-carboxylase] ligase